MAKIDPNAFNHPIYECSVIRGPNAHGGVKRDQVLVQAERWFDARAFGREFLGVPDVIVRKMGELAPFLARWQVRWVGTAATGTTNPLRRQIRFVGDRAHAKRMKITHLLEWHDG